MQRVPTIVTFLFIVQPILCVLFYVGVYFAAKKYYGRKYPKGAKGESGATS